MNKILKIQIKTHIIQARTVVLLTVINVMSVLRELTLSELTFTLGTNQIRIICKA